MLGNAAERKAINRLIDYIDALVVNILADPIE